MNELLSKEEIEDFIVKGYLKIDQAFSAETAVEVVRKITFE